jgi:hypothetical protein
MNELAVVDKGADWRWLKALVLDSVSSPITKRVYNLGLDEFFAWYGQEPRPGFTKATVNAWRGALEARALGSVSINVRITAGAQAGGRGCRQPKTLVDRGRVVELRDAGASWATIAEALGVPSTTIRTAYTQAGALRKTCVQETVPSCGKQTASGM